MSFRRRQILAGAGALVAAPFSQALAKVATPDSRRSVALDNIHTGEKLRAEYWADGEYDSAALSQVNHVLRDYRNGEVHAIAPALLDLLWVLRAQLGATAPYEVISGYRSPETNARLHAESSGVAAKSLHMQGMAIDIRVADRSLADLHSAALGLRAGGVGYYPGPDFVHVDVGRVRRW
jgi:uncharacterized protein YcbK (DUF882 family)